MRVFLVLQVTLGLTLAVHDSSLAADARETGSSEVAGEHPGAVAGGPLDDGDDDADDHDQARTLVDRGEIHALQDIVGSLAEKIPGEIVAVRLNQKAGRWVYWFRIVAPDGKLVEASVDAQRMTIIEGASP